MPGTVVIGNVGQPVGMEVQRMGSRFYVSLTPWVLFAVVDRTNGQGTTWAALAALAFTVAVIVWPSKPRAFTFLNAGSLVVFGMLACSGLILGGDGVLQTFGRVYAAAGLATVALASLATVPFTSHYLRTEVVPDAVATPAFRRASTAVAALWAAAAAGIALSFLLGADLPSGAATTLFNWIVPGAIAVVTARRAAQRWEDDFDPDDQLGGVGGFLGALDVITQFDDPT